MAAQSLMGRRNLLGLGSHSINERLEIRNALYNPKYSTSSIIMGTMQST